MNSRQIAASELEKLLECWSTEATAEAAAVARRIFDGIGAGEPYQNSVYGAEFFRLWHLAQPGALRDAMNTLARDPAAVKLARWHILSSARIVSGIAARRALGLAPVGRYSSCAPGAPTSFVWDAVLGEYIPFEEVEAGYV